MSGPRLNPNLLKVPLYIAGRSVEEVQEELGLSEVTKMASNESPTGASPLALEAAGRMLAEAHRYPGICDRELRGMLAARLGYDLTADNFVLANGGTDALRMVAQAFVFDGGNTVMSRVTFPMYHILTTAFGGEARRVAPGPGYGHDLTAMAEAIDEDTRVVFLCSPNNPAGDVIGQVEADAFMDRVPDHVVVVFDESYFDYVTEPSYADSLAYVKEGRNVLVVRSFSKSAGLANLRVGYLAGPAELIDYVRRARLPFHTGDVALAAAAASLDDVAFQQHNRETVWAGRSFLYESLCSLGLTCLPSQANFVTVIDPPVAADVLADRLLRQGFIVRAMAAFGLPNGLRASTGTREVNEGFVRAMRRVLEEE